MTTETLHHVTKTSKHNPTFFKVTIYFIWPLDIWAEYSLFKYITYFCSIVYSSPHVYINSYILFISNSHASHYDEEYIYIYIYIYVHLLVICVWWCMHVVCVLQYIEIYRCLYTVPLTTCLFILDIFRGGIQLFVKSNCP